MKKLSNLKGAKTLSNQEQKSVLGGKIKGEKCRDMSTVCYLPQHCHLDQNGNCYCA